MIETGHKSADHRGSPGFTLIEVIMVIVLVGIISFTVAMIMLQGISSFAELDARVDLRARGTLAMERVSRELRLIRCTTAGNTCKPLSTDITAWTSSEIRFVNLNYGGVGFSLSGTDLLLRQGSGAGDLPEDALGTGLSAFSFEYLKNDGTTALAVGDIWIINADMTFTRGEESFNLRASVHPRSFR
jgi:prepilin-type N-terminal cleavage/methylation domain-containing protein